jgi:hypothetical protein
MTAHDDLTQGLLAEMKLPLQNQLQALLKLQT